MMQFIITHSQIDLTCKPVNSPHSCIRQLDNHRLNTPSVTNLKSIRQLIHTHNTTSRYPQLLYNHIQIDIHSPSVQSFTMRSIWPAIIPVQETQTIRQFGSCKYIHIQSSITQWIIHHLYELKINRLDIWTYSPKIVMRKTTLRLKGYFFNSTLFGS